MLGIRQGAFLSGCASFLFWLTPTVSSQSLNIFYMRFLERFYHVSISLLKCDRFPCITRSIISDPTNFIQSRRHLDIINLSVKVLTNSNNLFGNPLHSVNHVVQIHSNHIKMRRCCSERIDCFPLSQVKIGSFSFSVPVRRVGCGGLVSTDCVRWWLWCVYLCVTTAFGYILSRYVLKTRISRKASFTLFFLWGTLFIKHFIGSHGAVG